MIKPATWIFLLIGLAVGGCKKESKIAARDTATASFTINGAIEDSLVVGTYDQLLLTNTTARLQKSHWNFGQGTLSTATDTVIAFSTPGTYTVTLGIEDSSKQTGHTSVIIRVLSRIIRTIEITSIDDVMALDPKPTNPADHFWIELKLGENNVKYSFPPTAPFTLPAPVIYKSDILTKLTPDRLPYDISLSRGIPLDFPALAIRTENRLGYTGAGYGIELYRASGTDTVLLSSSYAAQIIAQSGSISWPVADPGRNIFVAKYGDVSLLCDYE